MQELQKTQETYKIGELTFTVDLGTGSVTIGGTSYTVDDITKLIADFEQVLKIARPIAEEYKEKRAQQELDQARLEATTETPMPIPLQK